MTDVPERTGWRLLTGGWHQVSTDGSDGFGLACAADQPCCVVSPDLLAMAGAYRVRARMLIEEPTASTAGPPSASADLLLNARNLNDTYRLRLRVRTGVRYVTLTKYVRGVAEDLVDDIVLFDFDRRLGVEVRVEDNVFTISLDGRQVARCAEFDPLTGGGVGIAAAGATARFDAIEVTSLGHRPDRAPGIPPSSPANPRPGGVVRARIENDHYRAEFVETSSGPSSGLRADLFAKTDDDRWTRVTEHDRLVVLSGSGGSRRNLFASMDQHPVSFTELESVDGRTVRLRAAEPGSFTLTATWGLAGRHPRLHLSLTAETSGHFVIGYLGLTGRPLDQVDEVLCGPLQHAKMVRGVESIGLAELSAPLCLVQHTASDRPRTVGLFVPSDRLDFEHEASRGDDDQPIGMSLRSPDGQVQPVLYAPQYGERSWLDEGASHDVDVGLYARDATLYTAYHELLRREYDYRAYRRNVFGASLTDTVHNLIDLIKAGPVEDDSVRFRPSPSGWWSRAKGFVDIENDQTVRTTTTAVLLGAYYLTGDDDLYDERARPTIEFHLSRNGYGWTPVRGRTVYGDATKYRLGSTPFGTSALAALHLMLRGRVPAVRELALGRLDTEDYWLQRSPMSAPLAAHRMTGDPALLRRADELGRQYLAEHLEAPYEDNVDPHDFQTYYSKAWIDLLELYEETRDRTYLDAAHREAQRYVSQIFVRPVPSGSVTVPTRRLDTKDQLAARPSGWWDPDKLFEYPRDEVDAEEVPAWVVSPNGMGFEAMKTYRLNGYTLNPGWAPSLLRLAHHVGDDLLRDVAHNAVVGRYTNYPGYYYRQLTVHHMKPGFPYEGPAGNTTIYHHHAPGQLGMTIDYLITEHETRSNGEIWFPAAFEQNYVWFAFRVFGHRPGSFYGYDGVWLWMPRGMVSTGNPQVNWIAAEGGGRLFVSLTNESDDDEPVRLRLDRALVPWEPGRTYPVTTIRDNEAPVDTSMTDGRLETAVSGKGITAVVVHDIGPFDIPFHTEHLGEPDPGTYDFADDTPVGAVRGVLIPRPDGGRCDAYVQAATEQSATLYYSTGPAEPERRLDCAAYPNEWTIPIAGPDVDFTYAVAVGDRRSEPLRLRWTERGC